MLGGTLVGVLALVLGLVNLRVWGNVLGWGEVAWLVVGIAVVATALLGYLLLRLVLRPVYALTHYARAMKAGNQAHPPTHIGTPEFSQLGASVMAMGDSLHSRAEGMKAYADHVTHELTSPLTAIKGAAELLQGDVNGNDVKALSATIHAASTRMQRLLDDLGHHAKTANSVGTGTCRVSDALDGQTPVVRTSLISDGDVPLALADLRTILVQLARNAAEHGAQALTLAVTDEGLRVSDDGPGISAGNRDRIFDPFFTTRRASGGTGMGLSIVRSLVQARGGRIELLDSDAGAAFLISFD